MDQCFPHGEIYREPAYLFHLHLCSLAYIGQFQDFSVLGWLVWFLLESEYGVPRELYYMVCLKANVMAVQFTCNTGVLSYYKSVEQ